MIQKINEIKLKKQSVSFQMYTTLFIILIYVLKPIGSIYHGFLLFVFVGFIGVTIAILLLNTMAILRIEMDDQGVDVCVYIFQVLFVLFQLYKSIIVFLHIILVSFKNDLNEMDVNIYSNPTIWVMMLVVLFLIYWYYHFLYTCYNFDASVQIDEETDSKVYHVIKGHWQPFLHQFLKLSKQWRILLTLVVSSCFFFLWYGLLSMPVCRVLTLCYLQII